MEDQSFDITMPCPLSPSVEEMSFELTDNVHDWTLSSPEYDISSKNKYTRVSSLVYSNSPGGDIVSLITSPEYQRNINVDECSQESKDSGISSDVSSSPFTNILSFSSHCFSNSSSNSLNFQLDDSSDWMPNLNSIKKDKSSKLKRPQKMPSNTGSYSKIRRKLDLSDSDLQVQCFDEDKENIGHVRRKQTQSSIALKQFIVKSPSAVEGKVNQCHGLVDVSNTFDVNRFQTNDKPGRCFVAVADSQSNIREYEGFFKVSLDQSEGFIKEALDQSDEQSDLIGDFTAQHVLPVVQGRHKDLKSISHNTLSAVLRQEYSDVLGEVTIVDARYPYEYAGGHIEGAINLSTEDAILSELFAKTQPATSTKRNILIFHCEFSIERGPNMLRFLRSRDRDLHKATYPQLSYPEIYLLEDGYKSFYMSHPHHCSPGGYRPMLHPQYTEDLRRCRSGSNTSCDNNKKRRSKASKKAAVLQFDE